MVTLNTCSIMRKFLNHEIHLHDEEAANPQSHNFIIFLALCTNFNIFLCKPPADTLFKFRTLGA
jgi:hypothetical protein